MKTSKTKKIKVHHPEQLAVKLSNRTRPGSKQWAANGFAHA